MAKLKVLGEKPPTLADSQVMLLRNYIFRVNEELEYLLTHLGLDNLDVELTAQLDRMQERLETMPIPSDDTPLMDGDPSGGESAGVSRADHRHPTDTKLLPKIMAAYFSVLYEFTGTVSTVVTLPEDAGQYQLLAFQIYDSNGDMINAVTLPPRAFRNTVVKIYGSSSSQWGSFKLEEDGDTGLLTKGTFNRTSANTERVRVIGIGKVT